MVVVTTSEWSKGEGTTPASTDQLLSADGGGWVEGTEGRGIGERGRGGGDMGREGPGTGEQV